MMDIIQTPNVEANKMLFDEEDAVDEENGEMEGESEDVDMEDDEDEEESD
jgi:hypothetical protein